MLKSTTLEDTFFILGASEYNPAKKSEVANPFVGNLTLLYPPPNMATSEHHYQALARR